MPTDPVLTANQQHYLFIRLRKTFRDWRAWCQTPEIAMDIETMDSVHCLESQLVELGILKPRKKDE